jgi:hypothetical protein
LLLLDRIQEEKRLPFAKIDLETRKRQPPLAPLLQQANRQLAVGSCGMERHRQPRDSPEEHVEMARWWHEQVTQPGAGRLYCTMGLALSLSLSLSLSPPCPVKFSNAQKIFDATSL